jgi:hypothetical protein
MARSDSTANSIKFMRNTAWPFIPLSAVPASVFDDWHAVFEGTPDSVCRRLQATLGLEDIRCVSVPLEELFVELVGSNRLVEAS